MINSDFKVKTIIDKRIYNTITNDIAVFECPNNKGGFINRIFKNFYQSFNDSISSAAKSFDKEISNYISLELKENNYPKVKIVELEAEINRRYLDFIKKQISNKSSKETNELSFKINKANQPMLYDIYYNTFLPNDTIAGYFRGMLDSYASKPQNVRESIIFKDIYDKASLAIKNHLKVRIAIDNEIIIIAPYCISSTIEENHNYIIGSNALGDIFVCKLCHIKDIYLTNDTYLYDYQINDKINEIIQNGTVYYGSLIDIKVRLTEKGQRMLISNPVNRPKIVNIEKDIYYLKATYEQALDYFYPFGIEALFLEPKSLGLDIVNQCQKLINEYKNIY